MTTSGRSIVGGAFNKGVLRRKYMEERNKRLRADGSDQYVRFTGPFARWLEDPFGPRKERPPRTGHWTVVLVGGGFAGLVTAARLKEAGVEDVCVIDRAGDFGGAWYWNRYPGAQCDTASFVYMPLLEETGYMPTEKYARGPEILEHCRRIAKQYGLYDNSLFHTRVEHLEWDRDQSSWTIRTDRGDHLTARFVVSGIGPLDVPKLPGIAGMDTFRGHSFHTSRWDYAYTGGDPFGAAMTGLADKRVAVIGTGASAVQCVPHLARACRELYVFQRTPSSVDVRGNQATDPEWFARIATPGWQRRWRENFAAGPTDSLAGEDLVMDGWTDITQRVRAKVRELASTEITPATLKRAFEDADFEKMTEIRARIDAVVEDPETAAKLKPWYRLLCKRPCFHDEYLQTFNRPDTHLVDTDGKGVERITGDGVVVAAKEYAVDCVIYATGFEVGTDYSQRAGFTIVGRDGTKLSDYWADGRRTLHGIHVHRFPNLFLAQSAQTGSLVSNYPHNLVESARTIAATVGHALDNGFREVEVAEDAQQAWVDLVLSGPEALVESQDCTPGYFNNEGRPRGGRDRLIAGYPGGASGFSRYMDHWHASGDFAGLEFRR